MRLVSYNILDGGEGRADPLAEVILAQKPDIVCLVEADNLSVVQRIARRLKMEFVVGEGRRHGAAILSRWSIVESINHSPLRDELSDCVLEARIQNAEGESWSVGAIHLHPRGRDADEQVREREIEALLGIFSTHRKHGWPHLLAGDFNANAPLQKIDPALCKPRTREDIGANGGQLPRRAVKRLLDAGYLDSFHQVHSVRADFTGSFTTQFPGQRVDYVFTYGIDASRMKQAGIDQDRLAKYASDHFPAYLCIE